MYRVSHSAVRSARLQQLALVLSLSSFTACADDARKPAAPTGVPLAPHSARGGNGDNNGRILFTVRENTLSQIYSMNPDGSGVTRLTNSNGDDLHGSLSSDGKRVVFQSTRDDPRGEIYVMNVDGTGVTRLTFSFGFDQEPVWSKDGKRIAFASTRDAADQNAQSEDDLEIYVMNADGSGVTRLTNHRGPDACPSWSADGKQIGFVSDRGTAGTLDAFTMNADGSQVSRVTYFEAPEMAVSWSPGGKQLAVSTKNVFVVNTDGTQLTQLTYAPVNGADFLPSWSSDAKQIAFTRLRDGNYDIYRMAADGSQVTRLTFSANAEAYPSWQR